MPLKKSVLVKLGIDDKEFNSKLKAATTKLNKAARSMTTEGRRLSITSREIFVGLTLPMGLLGKNIFDATAQMEKMTLGLSTIAKSRGITAINQLIKDTQALAKLPGLGLAETFKAMQGLIGVGVGGSDALKIVEGLGIGIARAGGAAAEFNRVMIQLTQALSLGKLTMKDFRTVFEQLPEGRRVLEEAFGPGMSDLEALRNAGIPVAAVVEALAAGFQKLGADGFMNTMANQTENLRDSWLLLRATIGKELFTSTFQSSLSNVSDLMDDVTESISNMTDKQKDAIVRTTLVIAKFAVLVPLASFLASRFKLLGGLLLSYSKLAKGAVQATALMSLAFKGSGAAMVRQLRWFGLMGKGLIGMRAGLLKAGAAIRVFGGFLRTAIPLLGELYLAVVILREIFPSFDNWIKEIGNDLKWMGQTVKLLAIKHFPGLSRAIALLFNKEKKPSGIESLSKVMVAMSGRGAAWRALIERKAKAVKDLGDAGEKSAEQIRKLKKQLNDGNVIDFGMGVQDGFGSSFDNLRSSSKDNAGVLFANDRGNNFIAQTIGSGEERKQAIIDLNRIKEVATEMAETLSKNEGIASFRKFLVDDIAGGVIVEGIEGISDAFGSFFETVLSGGEDAFGSFTDTLKKSVKTMIVELVKLIAKLAIAAALVAIVFPGGGGLGALGSGGITGKGSGFLKGLFKGLGIPGFSEGGVVGGSSVVGDNLFARVNSGEMILTKAQQKGLASSGGRVRLSGEFKIRGRDLVYALEENQQQLNTLR